jgi:ribosomal protein S18 acetylase RimI-like enzyme
VELKIFRGREVVESGLGERVIEFDKVNMRTVWKRAGMEFPEEQRRKGLLSEPTFIVAFDGEAIAGYVEYLRSWNDPRYIYVGSIQIGERYRNTRLILELLDGFRSLVSREEFVGFETSVQKTNAPAVRLYRKIGFKLEENPRNSASWLGRAGKEILTDSPVIALISKWREKTIGAGKFEGSL